MRIGKWSDEEIDYLRATYPHEGTVKFIKKFNNRTPRSVRHKAHRLKIKCTKECLEKVQHKLYTEQEINLLKIYFPKGGATACIEAGLDRPAESIKTKAYQFQLYKKGKFSSWTDNEISILKRIYPLKSSIEVNIILPYRTKRSIQAKARKLGISYRGNMCPEPNRLKLIETRKGENSPNWRGGNAHKPYHFTFNDKFKDEIRKMFSYRCINCGKHQNRLPEKLSVHHIYGKKEKSVEFNEYVTLCRPCHSLIFTVEKELIPWFKYILQVILNG